MYRLFAGLSLPDIVADALTQLQSGVEGARWLPAENFHLTLQFIGETDRHGLAECADALAGVRAQAFELTLSGAGFFGAQKPRALWVGGTSPALVHLQSKVATALDRAGHPGERRKFAPHVTIGYAKGVSREKAAHFAAMHSLFSCGPFSVGEFHLYRSHPGNEGAHYEILESYPLFAPTV